MTPSLTPADRERLLGREKRCLECFNVVTKNYCRQCDEFFYAGHEPDCPRIAPGPYTEDHRGHRTY